MAVANRWATHRCSEKWPKWGELCAGDLQKSAWLNAEGRTRGTEPGKAHLCTPAWNCPEELPREYVFDLLSGTPKGCDEHICAAHYWQASQRNSHFIWNPGVVCATGKGLIPAKLQGMWSAHGACSQPNTLFASRLCRVTWWDMPSPMIKAGLWH